MVSEITRDYWPILFSPLGVGVIGFAVAALQARSRSEANVAKTALLWVVGVWLFTVAILTREGALWYEGASTADAGALLILSGWRVFMLLCLGTSVSALVASAAFVGLAFTARNRAPTAAP